MTDVQANNRRIARNTLMLYLRMLLVLFISLYTSRMLLNALGIVDYGICNVVSGVVTLFNFISGALTTSSQRFLSFELGKKDSLKLRATFTSCFTIHLFAACLICIFVEIIGSWLLYNKLVIPLNRFDAALWVFHLGVISVWFSIILIPYTACVISHERMGIFALMSIANAVFKLIIVYALIVSPFDHLIYYATLSLFASIITFAAYAIYCKSRFPETILTRKAFPSSSTKKIFSFASWNMIGQLAYILFSQGIDILLNIFFGPAVNAARAISTQVQGAIGQLSYNFQSALNPQIIKTYATGERERMLNLTLISTKVSFFLLLIVALPLSTETSTILSIWLNNVPDYAVIFTQISIWITLLDGVSNPLMTVAAATGTIRFYQIVVGGILLAIVPISYLFLSFGFPPYSVLIIHLTLGVASFIARLFIIKHLINISIVFYIKNILFNCLPTATLAFSLVLIIKYATPYNSVLFCFLRTSMSILITLVLSYTIGLNQNERHFVFNTLKSHLNRLSTNSKPLS